MTKTKTLGAKLPQLEKHSFEKIDFESLIGRQIRSISV